MKWIGYSDKFNEWLPVSKFEKLINLRGFNIIYSYIYIEWDSNRSTKLLKSGLEPKRDNKTRYSKIPYCCPNCKVTIMLGNKWKHQTTKNHRRNIEALQTSAKLTDRSLL